MSKVTTAVEWKITNSLPSQFGIMVDGWLEMSTSTHYIGMYAVYAKDGKRLPVMLAFAPLIDETTTEEVQEMVDENIDFATQVLIEASITGTAGYVDMKFVPPTSNTLERFFSKAKFFLGDYRYRITPEHFEAQLFLNVNKDWWDQGTVQDVINI